MAYITCCVSGADLKHKTFDVHKHFFFSFLSSGKKYFKNLSSKVCRCNISSYICRVIINNNNLKQRKNGNCKQN